jgi:uncharacterized protein YceK
MRGSGRIGGLSACALAAAMLSATGCGTINADRCPGPKPPVYRGVIYDLQAYPIMATDPDLNVPAKIGVLCALTADLPLSAAVDTLGLPIAAWKAIDETVCRKSE